MKKLHDLMSEGPAELVGEILREVAFPGEGFGCYSTFDILPGAEPWPESQRKAFWEALDRTVEEWDGEEWDHAQDAAEGGEGYTFTFDIYTVDVCWFWDGDGTLVFRLRDGDQVVRTLENGDCKKDYTWQDCELFVR